MTLPTEEVIDGAHQLREWFQQRLYNTISYVTVADALCATLNMFDEPSNSEARACFEYLLEKALNDCRLGYDATGEDNSLFFRLQEHFIRLEVSMMKQEYLSFDNARVQSSCGSLYLNGKRLKRNAKLASEWLGKSAAQDNVYSLYTLGQLHLGLELGAPQPLVAIGFLERASSLGDHDAPALLASLYAEGKGVRQDYYQAAEWAGVAARRGSLYAQGLLKTLERYMSHSDVNSPEAQDAQFEIAVFMFKSGGSERAINLITTLAREGHVKSEFELGTMLLIGKLLGQDTNEAVMWLTKAADGGYAKAQYSLGVVFRDGLNGTVDLKSAVKYFEAACKQDNLDACNSLGLRYRHGEGVAEDQVNAFNLFRKCADAGLTAAKFNLALQYGNGAGCRQDLSMFKKLLMEAAAEGDINARHILAHADPEDLKLGRVSMLTKRHVGTSDN